MAFKSSKRTMILRVISLGAESSCPNGPPLNARYLVTSCISVIVTDNPGGNLDQLVAQARGLKKRKDFSADEAWVKLRFLSDELGIHDRIQVIRALAGENVFRLLDVIGKALVDVIEDPRFTSLVMELASRVRGDYGGGPFWDGLAEAGTAKPTKAKEQVGLLLMNEAEDSAYCAAALMSGVARIDLEWFIHKTKQLLNNLSIFDSIAAFAAIGFTIKTHEDAYHRLSTMILEATIPQDDRVLLSYMACLSPLHKHFPSQIEGIFTTVAGKGSELVRSRCIIDVSSIATYSTDGLKTLAVAVGRLSDSTSVYCLCNVFLRIYRSDSKFVLDHLLRLLENNSLYQCFGIGNRDYLFEGIGIIDGIHAFDRFDDFLDKAPWRFLLEAADAFRALFKTNVQELVIRLRKWDKVDTARFEIRLEILKDTISDLLETDKSEERAMIDVCVGSVFEIADALGQDIKTLTKGEKSKVYQALILIRELQYPPRAVDCKQLIQNLIKIPSVRDFIGATWFHEMCRNPTNRHLLLYMFDQRIPDEKELVATIDELDREGDINKKMSLAFRVDRVRYSRNCISYWEDIFSRLGPSTSGIAQCRRDLLRNDRAEDILCELEVASLLLKSHVVDLRKRVRGLRGPYDIRPCLSEQNPILEVYNLQPERVLRYASGAHGLKTSRLKDKLLEKFEKKFDKNSTDFQEPYVFVVHTSSSMVHVDDIHIDDMYNGHDSLLRLNPSTVMLSGILIYNRDLAGTDNARLTAWYYPNPSATNPLTNASITELINALCTDQKCKSTRHPDFNPESTGM